PEPLMKTGRAHAYPSRQVFDSKPLTKMLLQPYDRDANALRLAVRLCHVVESRAALVQKQAEQNLALNHRGEHRNLRWRSQQSDKAQNRVEQSRPGRGHVNAPL